MSWTLKGFDSKLNDKNPTSQHPSFGVCKSQFLIQHSLNKGIVVQLTAYMIFPLILFLSILCSWGMVWSAGRPVLLWRSLICSIWLWQSSSDQVLTLHCVRLKQICSIISTAVPSQHSQQSTESRPNRVTDHKYINISKKFKLCSDFESFQIDSNTLL